MVSTTSKLIGKQQNNIQVQQSFLDTSLNLNNSIYNFKIYRKTTKQPTHWSSKIPKRYKCNIILGDLHWFYCISSYFSEEIKSISHKYEKADYLKCFINSIVLIVLIVNVLLIDFDDYIIPLNFFNIPKSFFLSRITILWKQQNKVKTFSKEVSLFQRPFWSTYYMENLTS